MGLCFRRDDTWKRDTRHQIRRKLWINALTSGWVHSSPWCQKSNNISMLRETHSITCGDICRSVRSGRLFATAVGAITDRY